MSTIVVDGAAGTGTSGQARTATLTRDAEEERVARRAAAPAGERCAGVLRRAGVATVDHDRQVDGDEQEQRHGAGWP